MTEVGEQLRAQLGCHPTPVMVLSIISFEALSPLHYLPGDRQVDDSPLLVTSLSSGDGSGTYTVVFLSALLSGRCTLNRYP